MKKIITVLTCATIALSAPSYAEGWFDKLKSAVGMGEEKAAPAADVKAQVKEQASESLDIMGMVSKVSGALDVNKDQAEGGLGAIFNYAKGSLSTDKFSELSKTLPGLDGILSKVPDVSSLSSGEGLGGLLDKASSYSDSLKSINEIKQQFEALGLKPEMITKYIAQAKAYLDTEQGQKAKQYLTEGLAALM